MRADFTPSKKVLLQGQASKLAKKHKCSAVYVNLIIKGEREIKTQLSKSIYKDLQNLVDLLSPNENQ